MAWTYDQSPMTKPVAKPIGGTSIWPYMDAEPAALY